MIGAKTEKGLAVIKDRSIPLTPRQRSAFILCDGKKSVEEILLMTAGMGVTLDDMRKLFAEGLLQEVGGAGVPIAETVQAGPASEFPASGRTRQQRYQEAYPVAIRLTSALGLRGFRLNLAVEACSTYEELKEIAPKIREAVGPQAFLELERALSS